MTTTPALTARYVAGEKALARLVHQVRAAEVTWYPALHRPIVRAATLCGQPLGGGRQHLRFAHDPADLSGAPCERCERALARRRTPPVWKRPPAAPKAGD